MTSIRHYLTQRLRVFLCFIFNLSRTPRPQWDQQQQMNQFNGPSIPSYSYPPCPSPWSFPTDTHYEGQRGFNLTRTGSTLEHQPPIQYQRTSFGNGELQQRGYNGPFRPYGMVKMTNSNIPPNFETYPPN